MIATWDQIAEAMRAQFKEDGLDDIETELLMHDADRVFETVAAALRGGKALEEWLGIILGELVRRDRRILELETRLSDLGQIPD